MIDPVSLAKLKKVHPALGGQIVLLVSDFEQATVGDELIISEGMRLWNEQEALWLKGRDAAGNVVDAGAIVTHAPPGHSWHEYGMAIDAVPGSLLNTAGWDPESPLWLLLTQLALKRGLVCGSCWHHKDLPHIQLTGKFGVSPDDAVRALYAQGGVAAVWAASGLTQ